ncbi:hypothetical protein [Nostoc sp. UHCC 0252]|uniref:hypothetical protein n=1 Tax=Nostoc sp. UHCC 0252 TaxID=3110241 RepID=UPI002B1FFA7D|nr:hypothetical protein [Nostoc sp. UHCC 0252]MEA5605526.1 hypothetical protein [Nostoc sp. UHCC 0252]
MSGLGFTRWGALLTIALGVSFCTVDYASAEVATSTSGLGNAGNITINSSSLLLQHGAQLVASTREQGNADTIKVNTTDLFSISGSSSNINSGLFVDFQSSTGTAGDIIITSPRVILDNNSGLNTESSLGNGGNISNNSTDVISIGNGGNISINTPTILIAVKPVPEPTLPLSVFAIAAFYSGWRLKRKHKQTHELKA